MRDYDPTTGRYIQGDPLGLVEGASVYGYALQNPMVYIDPFGLDAYVSIIDDAAGNFGHNGTGTSSEQTFGHYCAAVPDCFGGPGETKADDMTKVTRMLRIPLSDEDTQ